MRKNKTVSLSKKQFEHARKKMIANDWARAGDDEGISRYVQELIKADMAQPAPAPPIVPFAGKGSQRVRRRKN